MQTKKELEDNLLTPERFRELVNDHIAIVGTALLKYGESGYWKTQGGTISKEMEDFVTLILDTTIVALANRVGRRDKAINIIAEMLETTE